MRVLFSLEPLYELNEPGVMDTWLQWFAHMHAQLGAIIPGYQGKLLAFDGITYRNNKDFLGDRILLSQAEIRGNWKFRGNILSKIEYGDIDTEIENYICQTVREKLEGFTPEVVILLNTSPWLRKVCAEATFLYTEVSWLHRPPYPNHWQINPLGLGKGKVLEAYHDEILGQIEYTDAQQYFTSTFKKIAQSKIVNNRDAGDLVTSLRKLFSKVILLPLAGRFPFDRDTPIFAWIDHFMQNAPSDTCYLITDHPLTLSLQAGEATYLKSKYGNVFFDGKMQKPIGTQFLIPHVDAVYGDFSSVANQALFFDVDVLSFAQDIALNIPRNTSSNPLSNLTSMASPDLRDKILYWLLTHSSVPAHKLFDGKWLLDFITTARTCGAAQQPWLQFTKPLYAMDEWQRDEWCQDFTLLSPNNKTTQVTPRIAPTTGTDIQPPLQSSIPPLVRNSSNAPTMKGHTSEQIVQAIAFYLPQYHPIPENDEWWGKGFTEWTNVAKARPLFPGHYQPHIPADLGFYDLRLPATREAQAELAKQYGISGFCYYHYWFNGKRLLHQIFDEVIATGKPDFPFCLCWANENWTRAWDGRHGDILIEQNYCEEDDRNHIRWLLRVFKDKRYIRIDNKPLMLIYLSKSLPNAGRTVDIWREEAKKNGEGLYLCKVESAPWEYGDPRLNGFDACVEFQPDWGNLGPVKRQLPNGHVLYDYPTIVERMLNKPIPPYKRFPCVTPMWDNSPRKKQAALVINNSTPDQYERWLRSVIGKLEALNLDDNIVFINAWNEWGEGNHLEPDAKNGKAYLEATKKALSITPHQLKTVTKELVSIVILTFNQLEYTIKCVESIEKHTPEPYEIIFVDNGSSDGTRDYLKGYAKNHDNVVLILNDENKGFAGGNNQGIAQAKGNYIVLLNNDVVVTDHWLERLIAHLEIHPDIGMVGPMSNAVSGPQLVPNVSYGDNMKAMQRFARDFTAGYAGKSAEIMRLVGFCLLIKKEVIDVIGGLDENYVSGNYEDDDLCLRALIAGYKNIIAHDVFIHHYCSMTFKGNAIDHQATMKDNHQYFANKWKDLVEVRGNGYRVRFTKEQQLKKLIEWGEERFSQGDVRSALKIFERTLHLDRTNPQALNNIGVIQWQLGDTISAMNTFQISLSINPKDPDALGNLVQAATKTERFDLLKQNLLDILKQEQPDNPDVVKLINAPQSSVSTI